MKRGRNRRSDERGQSTVEFVLTIMLLMALSLFYFQVSLVSAFGNYTQYATFMAARAYLSAGRSKDDQLHRAEIVLTRMLKQAGSPDTDRFSTIAKGEGDGIVPGGLIGEGEQYVARDHAKSWQEGVRYTFKGKLFILPFGGSERVNHLTLTSESWLGREPSFSECVEELENRNEAQGRIAIFDNGC